MVKRIDTEARIESVRLQEQASAPVSPGAGYTHVFVKADGLYIVNDSDETIGPFITGSAASGGGTWQLTFWPRENEPPASNYATLDTRNSRSVLDFSVGEESVFVDSMPVDYAGGGVDLEIWFSTTATGTSGNAYYQVALERIVAETTNIDNDDFASAINGSAAVPPGQTVKTGTLSLTNGAQMDNVVAEDYFRLKFIFVSGTHSGDFELHYIEMRET